MEPLEACVSVKVQKLLDETEQSQQTPSKMDHNNATSLKFRHFACIEWMLRVECWRHSTPEEELRKLTRVVNEKRKDLAATRQDLKMMEIPRRNIRKEKTPLHSFPNYLELDELARKKILEKLTGVHDRLSLLEAIPDEGRLTNWNKTNFQFELVFPILMQQIIPIGYRSYNKFILDWKSIHNLGQVNPYFCKVISDHFKNVMPYDFNCISSSSPSYDYFNVWITQIEETLSGNEDNASEWLHQNQIIPFRVIVDPFRFDDREWQLDFLKQYGNRILHCFLDLSLDAELPPLEIIEVIQIWLDLVPNIVSLTIYIAHQGRRITREELQGHWNEIKYAPLPELPSLKSVNLKMPGELAAIKWKLLSKYGMQLQNLIDEDYLPKDFETVLPSPALTGVQLNLNKFYDEPDITQCHSYLDSVFSTFVQPPLKIIHLNISCLGSSKDAMKRGELPQVLTFLSHNFGGTLEELAIQLDSSIHHDTKDEPPVFTSATWMTTIMFPNVKTFSMSIYPHPDDTGLLLLFPYVEKLSFGVDLGYKNVVVKNRPQIVELWYDREEMKRSNVWKLLPGLEVFYLNCIIVRNANNPTFRRCEWELTRNDCKAASNPK